MCTRSHTQQSAVRARCRTKVRHAAYGFYALVFFIAPMCERRATSDSFRGTISIVIGAELAAYAKRVDNLKSIVCFECEQKRRNERNRNKIMMMSIRYFVSLLSPHTCDAWALSSPSSISIELCRSNLCGYSSQHLSATITTQSGKRKNENAKWSLWVCEWVEEAFVSSFLFIRKPLLGAPSKLNRRNQ